jgi:predicted nucleotidyltransferase
MAAIRSKISTLDEISEGRGRNKMTGKITNEKVQNELNLLTQTIVKTVPAEQVYLFGSYAYGEPTETSDLDIYVVLRDDSSVRESEAMDAIGLAFFPYQTMPLDILAYKRRTFDDRKTGLCTIERAVWDNGINLYTAKEAQ